MALLVAASAGFAYTPGAGIAGTPHDWSGVNATKLLLWVEARGGVTTYNTGTPYLDPATGKQGVTTVTIGQCTKMHEAPHAASGEIRKPWLEPHAAGHRVPLGLPRHDGRHPVRDLSG